MTDVTPKSSGDMPGLVKRENAKRKFYELIESNAASAIDDETGMVLVNADALADDLAALSTAPEGMVMVPREAHDDLVKALKQVMGWIDAWSPNFTEDEEWPECAHYVREALAKAEGRTL